MKSEAWIRGSLWLTVPFNFLAAYAFSFPLSGISRFLELPQQTPNFYTFFTGCVVCLFGFMYIWNSIQPSINKPLLAVGAFGKLMAVSLSAILFAQGEFSGFALFLISGDLLFALFWLFWLLSYRGENGT